MANALSALAKAAPMAGKSALANLSPDNYERMMDPSLGPLQAPAAPAMPKPTNALAAASGPSPYSPTPKPKQHNLLQAAVGGFQRGFDPKGFAAQQEQSKMDGAERAKQTLALMQQQRALPEADRMQWALDHADTILQVTGGDIRQMQLNPEMFTDRSLDGQVAALSAKMGQGPVVPKPASYQGMGLGNGGVGVLNQATGQMEVIREPTVEPPKPTDPVKMEQFIDATGQVWDRNPYTGESRKADVPRARVPGEGGGNDGISAALLYRMERDKLKDEQDAKVRDDASNAALIGLRDGQRRVTDLINHKGFDGIYGTPNLLGINAGPKLTNFMNEDELNAMALLEQIGGDAFLTGVQKMRGTGPLSDNEGKRVSAAVTRLTNRMQSPEAARAAAIEFTSAMKALEAAYLKESGGAAMPDGVGGTGGMDEVESSGIFDDVAEGASNLFGGIANMFGGGGAPARVGSAQERDALPPGTRYLAPDGSVRVKK